MQKKDLDFRQLKETLSDLQSKYRELQERKLLQDSDFKQRHDSNIAMI